MTDKKQIKPIVANAIIWAALMIATAIILRGEVDSEKLSLLMFLNIAGWFSVNQLLVKIGSAPHAE